MADPSKWTHPMIPTRPHGPPSVIHAGLMRTGTLSMTRAYDILGLRAHHGLDMVANVPLSMHQWTLFELAAESTWPSIPNIRLGPDGLPPPKFTRENWDALFSSYDCLTDVASLFADQLFLAYPEAKVVIVERDFESWWRSFEHEVVIGLFHPFVTPALRILTLLTGIRSGPAMQKMILGAFHASNVDEVRLHAKEFHTNYYAKIRELVSPNQRLEYKMGDGWEPLCEFLGKPVPNCPFPHVNDKIEHRARQTKAAEQMMGMVWDAMRWWVFGSVGVVGAGVAYLVMTNRWERKLLDALAR